MSLNVRNQECSRWRDFQFNLVSGKDVGHGATKLIGQNYTKKIQTHSCCCHWTVTSFSTDYLLSFSYSFTSCWRLRSCKKCFRAYFILIIKTKTVALSLVCSQICPALCLHSVFSGTSPDGVIRNRSTTGCGQTVWIYMLCIFWNVYTCLTQIKLDNGNKWTKMC